MTRMNTNTSRLLLAAPLLWALLGCSPQSDSTAPPNAKTTDATAPAASASLSQTTIDPGEKLHHYIECYNKLDTRPHESIQRYTSWVKNMHSGPTGTEKVVYGLYGTDPETTEQCRATFEIVAKQPPAMPALDEAGAAYITALAAMDKQVTEADAYYSRENYKDDNFARGKSLHAPLVASFTAFERASKNFSDALDTENDKVLAARLAAVEKNEGRSFAFFRMALMAQAKGLVNVLGDESFDVAVAQARLSAFEALADESLAYAQANKNTDSQGSIHGSFFQSAIENYRIASKERFRRVRDKVPYSEGDQLTFKSNAGWMVEGSPDKLIRVYNELVEASNRF
jgi:Protein of unknown function (DUF3829)